MSGALYITDGTTRINLLTGIDGFHLVAWNPALPGRKQTWRDSPLSDGRKPALMKWSDATEAMSFHVARFSQDDVIYDTQELRRLLMKAEEYFFGVNDTPVWIEAQGDCETNTRYAVVVTWGTGNDSDPYHKPFDLDNPVMSPWTLTLERQHWRDVAPGSSTCVQLSATQDYYLEQKGNYLPTVSDDDCFVDTVAGSIDTGRNIRLGRTAGSVNIWGSGVRVRNVAIPQGAYIIYAYVAFVADNNWANDSVNVVISCDDVDNAALFSTYANFAGRARTTAHTHWSAIPHWAVGTTYNTADISSAVQEVVNRAGWASGNNLAILFDDDASTAAAERQAISWDDVGVEPTLYVHWFDSHTQTYGRSATCNDEVYIANKHNLAQLTHIYYYDNSAGTFSNNLLTTALPYAFLPPAPLQATDWVYFGISTAAPDSGPFCSLVFDISTVEVNITNHFWIYYNGGWVALTVRDNTNANGAMTGQAFDTLGVNSVHWVQPSDWVPTIVNGVNAYWVAYQVAGINPVATPPIQQNRHIYTAISPYLDTTAANVKGDIQALAKLELEGESGDATVTLSQSNIFAGLRTYSRGANFTSFLNLADEQNPSGITVTVNGGTATFVTDVTSPSGRSIDWTTGGAAGEAWLAYITIPTALVDDFTGEFRNFMRLVVNSATAGNLQFRLKVSAGDYLNVIRQTDLISPNYTGVFDLIDFHKIVLPPLKSDLTDTFKNIILRIDGTALAAVHAHLIDLANIPADECFIELRQMPTADTKSYANTIPWLEYRASEWKLLDVDSTIPRRFLRADVENTTGYKIVSWTTKNNTPAVWQPNEHQRWWFLQSNLSSAQATKPYDVLSAQAWQVSRYLSMRGKR